MCVSVSHAIACHGKEKNKKRSDTLWGLVCHACSKTAHSGNRGTSDRRVFHAFCDHDDCCWTDQQKNKLGNDLLYGLAAHCISLYQYYLEQSTSRFCHWSSAAVLQYLFSLLFFAAVYLLLSITLFRWLPRNGFYQAGPRRTLSAAAVLFLSLFSYYNFTRTVENPILRFWFQLYCVTFLYLQAELFKKSEVKQEYALMERMWYQQKKQYDIAKDQMQVIDRKCHDLKYQVAAMRHIENPAEREKNLKELEQSIRIYDSIVKTGNEILDTLLSEKSLICEARDITMHCVIDGKKLFFMDSIDIYALFGNAIDNAIECVEKFSEKEMRFIDICVAEKQHFLYIRFSNPIERAPEYENDLPKTTKKNKQYHGIGLKSIRHIAEKYGGISQYPQR